MIYDDISFCPPSLPHIVNGEFFLYMVIIPFRARISSQQQQQRQKNPF